MTNNDDNKSPVTLTSRDVLLFVPNLIGYSRVVASLFSFFLMVFLPDQWFMATMTYIYSFAADLFDGMAARKLNQCSSFGGLLDMVTDRCSTLGLFFILFGAYGYGQASGCGCGGGGDGDGQDGSGALDLHCGLYRMMFLSLAVLDIASHWCQMHSTATLQTHHKSTEGNADRFFLVRWYYQCYPFFGYCCISAEATYITMYVVAHADEGSFWYSLASFILKICIPGHVMKQIVNVFQLCSACAAVAEHDAKEKTK